MSPVKSASFTLRGAMSMNRLILLALGLFAWSIAGCTFHRKMVLEFDPDAGTQTVFKQTVIGTHAVVGDSIVAVRILPHIAHYGDPGLFFVRLDIVTRRTITIDSM